MVFGFHVIADSKARREAEENGVEVRTYTIIYELMDDVRKAMQGLLSPEILEEVIGHAEVLQTFKSSKIGTIAGLRISDGIVRRDARLRVTRDGVVSHEGKVGSLKRFKEDVKEVREGFECGLVIEGFQGVEVGDIIEFSSRKTVARLLTPQ
jgi:translation initiation factor IF-2